MKRPNSHLDQAMNFVKIQDRKDFDNFRYAGKVTADCLSMLEMMVAEKTTKSLLELDMTAEEFFLSKGTHPIFKGYHGFPNAVCCSVNKQLVHSIPTDYKLQDGDLITFDTGCQFKTGMADSAITCIYGKPKEKIHTDLVEATKKCLYAAIKSISLNGRVGAIGHTIFNTARKNGFKVIENYSGHGISDQIHSDPVILNRSEIDDGVRFQPGMVIAIEPLLIIGSSTETKVADNNWDVLCNNICAHFEHTVLILKDGIEVMTHRDVNEIIEV